MAAVASPMSPVSAQQPSANTADLNGGSVRRIPSTLAQSSRNGEMHQDRPAPVKRRNLGEWNLEKTIGAGSMGKVKLARHHVTGEQVAVKIIPRIKLRDPHIKDPKDPDNKKRDHDESKEIRTIREAAISTLLQHPYICGMRDVMIMSHHYYMLFEYVDGGQMLDFIISHGKLKEKGARKFARQIASALDYCHYNSIAHRDLKIENILISKEGDIKIIDFGLSNLYSPRSQLSTFCGSLYFAAPELLNAKPYTGPEVDVWSFGIVLYVLVCGKVPFDDQNMPALHAKIKKGIVEYPNWISAECKHLISRMLVVDSSQRATMAEVIEHPWMSKGYDGPMSSYTSPREPLELPLDKEILRGMTGFDFGSVEMIEEELTEVLKSDEYCEALAVHKAKQSLRNSAYPAMQSSTEHPDKLSSPSSGLDPTIAYHPLISIYYLVREKRARDEKIKQPASSIVSAKTCSNLEIPPIPVTEVTAPSTATYEVQKPQSTHSTTSARARSRTHGEVEVRQALDRVSLAPPPVSENKKGGIFRRLSSRRYRAHDRPAVTTPTVLIGGSPAPEITTPRKSLSVRRANAESVEQSQNGLPGKNEQFDLQLTPDNSYAKTNVGRSATVSDRTPSHGLIARKPPGASNELAKHDQLRVPQAEQEDAAFAAKAQRAKSLGGARGEQIRSRREGAGSPQHTMQGSVPEQTATQDEYIQKTGLKGLFSVSTTSSKSPQVIRVNLLRTLDKLGISHKEIKGGYNCLYRPSIDLNAVVDSETVDRASPSSLFSGLTRTPSKANRKLSFRRPSRGRASSSLVNADVNDESNDSVFDSSAQQDSAMVVRFDISIVKVSWFSLHGVQFKRVSGNSWQYKSLASKILSELNL